MFPFDDVIMIINGTEGGGGGGVKILYAREPLYMCKYGAEL